MAKTVSAKEYRKKNTADLLAELKIDNPILIGHSFGGRISIVYASCNPVTQKRGRGVSGYSPRTDNIKVTGYNTS